VYDGKSNLKVNTQVADGLMSKSFFLLLTILEDGVKAKAKDE